MTERDDPSEALRRAVESGSFDEVLDRLDAGGDFLERSEGGTSAVLLAAGLGRADVLRLFLSRGLVEAWDERFAHDDEPHGSDVALLEAALSRSVETVSFLLALRASPDAEDEGGRSALHRAVYAGRDSVVELLLEEGADPNASDALGRTPLHWARMLRRADLARILRRAGADPTDRDRRGKTPAALAGVPERLREAAEGRFLYYPGAKNGLLEAIAETIPRSAVRLVEPFVGGGSVAVGLAHLFDEIEASDANPDLVAALSRAAEDPEGLIADVDALFVRPGARTKAFYDARRAAFNDVSNPLPPNERVATYVFMNRLGFKGLQRVSSTGFSVPFWEARAGESTPAAAIRRFADALGGKASFSVRDFRRAFDGAGEGDLIYLDPPYLPEGDKKDTFVGYAGTAFGVPEHRDLAELCRKSADAGATCVVSNHDSPLVRELYASADEIRPIVARRGMSDAKGKGDSSAREIVAVWLPPDAGIVDALLPPVDPVAALDPLGVLVSRSSTERLVLRVCAANGWVSGEPREGSPLAARDLAESGRRLLSIARSGVPPLRRLVFGRRGRERLLSLTALSDLAERMVTGSDEALGEGFELAERLLAIVEEIEAAPVDPILRDALLRRSLKTKFLATTGLDGGPAMLREGLAERYLSAAAAIEARGWRDGSEPRERLLLCAERCAPRNTRPFAKVCEVLAAGGVSERAFLESFPSPKKNADRGAGAGGREDLDGELLTEFLAKFGGTQGRQ